MVVSANREYSWRLRFTIATTRAPSSMFTGKPKEFTSILSSAQNPSTCGPADIHYCKGFFSPRAQGFWVREGLTGDAAKARRGCTSVCNARSITQTCGITGKESGNSGGYLMGRSWNFASRVGGKNNSASEVCKFLTMASCGHSSNVREYKNAEPVFNPK